MPVKGSDDWKEKETRGRVRRALSKYCSHLEFISHCPFIPPKREGQKTSLLCFKEQTKAIISLIVKTHLVTTPLAKHPVIWPWQTWVKMGIESLWTSTINLQSAAPERLDSKEGPKRDAWISLGRGIEEISWTNWGGGEGMGTWGSKCWVGGWMEGEVMREDDPS